MQTQLRCKFATPDEKRLALFVRELGHQHCEKFYLNLTSCSWISGLQPPVRKFFGTGPQKNAELKLKSFLISSLN